MTMAEASQEAGETQRGKETHVIHVHYSYGVYYHG